jgi:hypothetical protein
MTSLHPTTQLLASWDEPISPDDAELAAVAFLARYSGRTLDAYRHDLRNLFQWGRRSRPGSARGNSRSPRDVPVIDGGTGPGRFLDGGSTDAEDVAVAHLGEVVARHPHVNQFHDLPLGWHAWTKPPDPAWHRSPHARVTAPYCRVTKIQGGSVHHVGVR